MLLVAYLLVKGFLYIFILPPFEGWDEYQHLGFIKYVEDNSGRPTLNESFISRDLIRQIVRYPVPDAMLEQSRIKDAGAVGYEEYFRKGMHEPVYNPDHEDVRLYQAQHGIVYYKLMSLATGSVSMEHHLITKIALLRAVNLVLTVCSVAVIFWLVRRLSENPGYLSALALLIASQPMIILNGSRVANDPLAIFTGTIVIAMGFLPEYRKKISVSLLVGLLIGISCWTKSISAILFPFWFLCIMLSWHDRDISFRKMAGLLCISYAAALLVLSYYFLFNFKTYGMLFVMQESIVNSNNNRSIIEVLNSAQLKTIFHHLLLKWSEESIWSGGWSFLRVRDVRNIVKVLMIIGLLGWCRRVFASSPANDQMSWRNSLLCLVLVLLTSMAITYHFLQSTLAWGHGTTNPWYICITLPFYLIVVANGAYLWSERVGFATVFGLSLVYIYSDFRGMINMAYFYSGEASGSEALRRISSFHPSWVPDHILLIGFSTFLILISLILFLVLKPHLSLYRRGFR